ncbi:hypothetical protein PLESTM_001017600 [Pleodorina starrii]|nr:hypothetical protein PLESTM_001017600 [Pleodorina starrii]
MAYTSQQYGSARARALTLGVINGTAYLLRPVNWRDLSHHAWLLLSYVRMVRYMQDTFGRDLPDVAFAITTNDGPKHPHVPLKINPVAQREFPAQVAAAGEVPRDYKGPFPVFGYCKTDYHADTILVPNFHFHMRKYSETYLKHIPDFNQRPWSEREPKLFGRFSHYKLIRGGSGNLFVNKLGVNGTQICDRLNKSCPSRDEFIRFARLHKDMMDVHFSGMRPMSVHARYKYLVNLEGQALSSRMEVLLPLGSLVFKERSGYYAYYYHLLKHRENVMMFWDSNGGPEDILQELAWAKEHDDEAAAIAARGQQLAAKYLSSEARVCYWYRLLHEYAKTFSYRVDLSQWPGAVTLDEVLDRIVVKELGVNPLKPPKWGP